MYGRSRLLCLMSVVSVAVALCGLPATRSSGATAAGDPSAVARAEKTVELVGIDRGLCAVIGADQDLLARLVVSTKLLVHVREPNADKVAELRGLAEQIGVEIDRIVLDHESIGKLPYADNLVDVLLATAPDVLASLPASEVLRVLRPEGRAIVCATRGTPKEKLQQWAGSTPGAKEWTDELGAWLALAKPPLKGADEWSHWEHGPDNNPVSTDQVIKAPYLTQFLAEPWYICMPAITTIAGGRTFLATGHIAHHIREWHLVNKLIARNGYNGIVLWERDLPKGYLSHRSAFVATRDAFYMIDDDTCLTLDPQTGQEKGRIAVPGTEGDWKWMAMEDGVLYVMAGDKTGAAKVIKGDRTFGGWGWGDLSEGYYRRPRVPWGFGHTVAAYRMDSKRVLWLHKEQAGIDSRALALRDGRLFLYCPGKHLRCLSTKTGETVWTNAAAEVLRLIGEPGRKLTSTPGFRSACMAVATPKALIIQGQTRMNVIAISTETGKLLWHKKKISNNPNVICLDRGIVLGVGSRSNHVLVDPVTGAVIEELNFRKAGCTRLTACPDSLFVRGEGTLRYDRATKKMLVDGAVRPGCNDGALPANGMLYLGPWACDCNLSLIGAMGKCSAGDFPFGYVATEAERLQVGEGNLEQVQPLDIAETDWPTYRANIERTSSTEASLARPNAPEGTPPAPGWRYVPKNSYVPAPPVSAGNFVFVAGTDGKVRALEARRGEVRWTFATRGPIKMPPTIWEGRAYVGSGDGHVYALEAATGRLLWRFRAAPVERLIMVYGNLCSTWPVNTGVLVHEGVAYFAAGIIDHDGTYVYALDAKTGRIKWQNNTCGHLNPELRKGVSAQGNLTIQGGQLLMAGGNQITPARFDLKTGECLSNPITHGHPKANHGKFVGVFRGKFPIYGGRTLYSSPENVANKDSFRVHNGQREWALSFGGIPPAWSDSTMALVSFRDGKLTACDAGRAAERMAQGMPAADGPAWRRRWQGLVNAFEKDGAVRWSSDLGQRNKFEVVSIAVCPQSVVAVMKHQVRHKAHPQWFVTALSSQTGAEYWFWRYTLSAKPLPGGLMVGSRGQVVVAMLNGSVQSFAPRRPPKARPKAKAKRKAE